MAKKNEKVVKLNILERILVRRLLPKQSDIITQVLVADIIKKMVFSQQESKSCDIKFVGEQISWKKQKTITVSFMDAEIEVLKSQVQEMDKQKSITQEMLPLVLKLKDL